MRLIDLEAKLAKARAMGAQDDTEVGIAAPSEHEPPDRDNYITREITVSVCGMLWLNAPSVYMQASEVIL